MSIVTTIHCDHCGRAVPTVQTPKSTVVINQREYDLCPACQEKLLGPLTGKGRSTPPITLTPTQPAPWVVPFSPWVPAPTYPGIGTGTYPTTEPTITWNVGAATGGSSAMLSSYESRTSARN